MPWPVAAGSPRTRAVPAPPATLESLQDLFAEEQRLILDIFGSRTRDHPERLGILDALERRDEPLAVVRPEALPAPRVRDFGPKGRDPAGHLSSKVQRRGSTPLRTVSSCVTEPKPDPVASRGHARTRRSDPFQTRGSRRRSRWSRPDDGRAPPPRHCAGASGRRRGRFDRIRGPKEAAPLFDAPHAHPATGRMQLPYTRRAAEWLEIHVHGGDPTAAPR